MKRIIVFLAIVPCLAFGLEKVNLIKDHSFEDNSDAWMTYAKTRTGKDLDPTAVSRHDSAKAYKGYYSGYCDTRKPPSPYEVDSAVVIQGLVMPKIMTDLDSLTLNYSVVPIIVDKELYYDWMHAFSIVFFITDPSNKNYRFAVYLLKCSDQNPTPIPPTKAMLIEDFIEDTLWHFLNRDVKVDLTKASFSNETIIDSICFIGWGAYYPPWRGLKNSFDDIRLTGYADYDVGVKAILSKDSIGNAYIPTARIKNFGRKAADSFLVIASIEGSSGVVYADTLSWSLAADTEDTVSFKEFKPSDAASCTLTVSTVMTPDESDEDDAMFKPLYGSGIEEPVTPVTHPSPSLQLDVARNTPSSILVSYSIPNSEQGTISLYDPSGRRIESLPIQGEGKVSFKPGLATGVYFIRLETGHSSIVRKVVVLD